MDKKNVGLVLFSRIAWYKFTINWSLEFRCEEISLVWPLILDPSYKLYWCQWVDSDAKKGFTPFTTTSLVSNLVSCRFPCPIQNLRPLFQDVAHVTTGSYSVIFLTCTAAFTSQPSGFSSVFLHNLLSFFSIFFSLFL